MVLNSVLIFKYHVLLFLQKLSTKNWGAHFITEYVCFYFYVYDCKTLQRRDTYRLYRLKSEHMFLRFYSEDARNDLNPFVFLTLHK